MPETVARTVSLLIDSNIFIAAEQYGEDGHTFGAEAAELLRLAGQLRYHVMLSNGTRRDLMRDEPLRGGRRTRQLAKYHVLDPVVMNFEAGRRAGFPEPLSPNDLVDLEILTTYLTGVASWLVTNDATLRKRAKKCDGAGQVYSLLEALETLRRLISPTSTLPAIDIVKGYTINPEAPIFQSLKRDYPPEEGSPGFETWWRDKVVREQRDVIILGTTSNPEGIAVIKPESEGAYGLEGTVMKLCTFKVSDEFQGTKRGELLLKGVIDHARARNLDRIYVEVMPSVEALPGWLEEFGFRTLSDILTSKGEIVMVKALKPLPDSLELGPLVHNITYGPGSLRVGRAHVVPIRNEWHHRLLPEADPQQDLFPAKEACGNAIRKAYLCHSNTGLVEPGDLLLFLRTNAGGESRVTCVGVVEKTLRSETPEEIIEFVGSRTVYTASEIETMCSQGAVLAILFRFDRVILTPWRSESLRLFGVMNSTAQSIASVPSRGMQWLSLQLDG